MTDLDASSRRGRYEFLDALRGVAAMMVVVQHAVELVSPPYARFSLTYFRPGEFGVVLFFLCSGFIIPASLERHGSQARFWVGRFFRLYPLYWTVLAAVVVLHFGFGRYPLEGSYLTHPVRMTAANATMIQDYLDVPLALGQSWTLAYELAFYGMVSALFVAGMHKRSAPIAVAGFAVAMVAGTQRVPVHAIVHLSPRQAAILVIASGGAAGLLWVKTRAAGPQRYMAALVGAALVVLVVNRPENFNTTGFFFGTLFAGTAIYRWTAGQLTSRTLALVGGGAVTATIVMAMTSNIWWLDALSGARLKQAEVATYLAAYGVFFIALIYRDLQFPRPLIYLGTISYSLYLNHSLAIYGIGPVMHNRVLTPIVWVGASVLASAVTYRLIEKPSIDVGHRLGARASRGATKVPAPPS